MISSCISIKNLNNQKCFILFVTFLIVGIVLSGCNNAEVAENEKKDTSVVETKESEEKVDTVEKEGTIDKEKVQATETEAAIEPDIDTSIFEYVTDVELTDAIDINQHLTVKLNISEEAQPGMAVQNILKQTFDFIQQDDLEEAKTITIIVSQNDKKITQYTVQKDKFFPNDNDPMSGLILDASEVEFMSDEVKAFGKDTGSW
ncbi:hypothetical protein [Psychrobacillus sp. FSL K6-1267]|uniref:hypothetical protein n=1 Tax=Psychrobacillus sp. FSL K6-1267 TaxID=2921543 RepID=UPI0030F9F2FB